MKISIITATYNSAQTLQDTINSVRRQSFTDYEHIIIDGGSTDGTLEIIKANASRYGKGQLKWISEPDAGIYDAMNKGIAMATGDVIGLLNSDDFYTSFDVLLAIAKVFERQPDIDAVYGDIHYSKPDDTTRLVRFYSSKKFHRWQMRFGFMPAHPSFYCKKATYERFKMNGRDIENFRGNPDIAYFNTSFRIASDFELLLRMIYKGRIKTSYIWKDFVTMRTGGASNAGMANRKIIFREHLRALARNGIYSNFLILSLRYPFKVFDLIMGKLHQW